MQMKCFTNTIEEDNFFGETNKINKMKVKKYDRYGMESGLAKQHLFKFEANNMSLKV